MEGQPTNKLPTLREVQEIKKRQGFPLPKPYVEEEVIKETTRFSRQSTIIARAKMESTVGAL